MKRAAPLLFVLASGCASVFAPGPDYVAVSTRPPGARVYLDDVYLGRSPLMAQVSRRSKGIFKLELEGYDPKMIDRNKRLNPVTLVNALFFIPFVGLGFVSDATSGDIGKYSSEPLRVELAPAEPR